MLPLLGGTIGGALVLLAAVITVCCLLRSRKQRHTDGSAERPGKGHQRNQDPEQGEDDVMVGNPIYSSYDGGVDYAQIGGARQTASTKDPQASPGTSQEVADIYAIPDKQRSSTLNAEAVACDVYSVVQKQPKSEGQGMSHQPTDKDAEAVACDVYSVVQKQPKTEGQGMSHQPTDKDAEAVACDVYSVVQKQPKTEGQGMSHQPTDKDDGAAECDVYSVVQKQPK
ncbi:uncharacterized protein LOC124148306 isoform X1 [Haliotis rufescens]|uniref:uncharacterized protein LOC124148306 isoform X1 n=1 Tax=Haliotis rufescens TaxID=6454 RepID=UPI00201FAE6E|nr:uncharacterized protein LOC124148306 isoform X1 [Haliotis rufescens]